MIDFFGSVNSNEFVTSCTFVHILVSGHFDFGIMQASFLRKYSMCQKYSHPLGSHQSQQPNLLNTNNMYLDIFSYGWDPRSNNNCTYAGEVKSVSYELISGFHYAATTVILSLIMQIFIRQSLQTYSPVRLRHPQLQVHV